MLYSFMLYGASSEWRRDIEAETLSAGVRKYIELLETDGGITSVCDGDEYDIAVTADGQGQKHIRVTAVFKPAYRIDVMHTAPVIPNQQTFI